MTEAFNVIDCDDVDEKSIFYLNDFPEDQRAALQAIFSQADTPEKQRKLCSHYYRQAIRIDKNISVALYYLGAAIERGEIAPELNDFPEDHRAVLQAIFSLANTPEKRRALSAYYKQQGELISQNPIIINNSIPARFSFKNVY